ncbi:CheR family methyltransferase [Stutzerimonas tarimensis]|uniref:CheR family methyltransferase n=1 Tax=Stutzerimonas tarimensis TaxID=1507735 RepID=A0ABV7T4E7_9GAMM
MSERSAEIELKLLIEAIYLRYGYDFRDYSLASLRRRVTLALQQMKCESASQLQHRILYDAQLFMELLQYLTIPVSEMFRDPRYFAALREQVFPLLRTYPSLKVWIAGCSTGEEVYSLAILLEEERLLDRTLLYATDINPRSLEQAQRGIFPVANVRKFTRNYQLAGGQRSFSEYYTAAYDSVILDKRLAERVTFADHSLATDSVFSEMHLISCRNVLIYFNKPLQNRAFGLFHDSLCHRGFLGLGIKETVEFSAYASRFEPVARDERIFRKL